MFITKVLREVTNLTRVNVVDNSVIGQEVRAAGKKVKIIHIYRKEKRRPHGGVGDKVLVTILGQMKKAYVVGCVQKQQPMIPKFDTNNVVLVNDQGIPLGTRITSPIPNYVRHRGAEVARIMAIATRFF